MNKFPILASRITSLLFHPLLIPMWGLFLLGNSGSYFALLPWSVKKYMFLVVFISTCALPALSMLILSMNARMKVKTGNSTDRILPLLLSAVFYYLGYLMLEKMHVFQIYNIFMIAFILVQIALIVSSLRWNVSTHMAAIGALTGGFIALSFRMHENPLPVLAVIILLCGLVASARLILLKHTAAEVFGGFLMGFLILSMVVTFI